MNLERREHDIRQWWLLLSGRYPPAAADNGWILCTDWPRWRDIGFLLGMLDRCRAQARDAVPAADDARPTDSHPTARARPPVPTSDDTIAVDWTAPVHKRPGPALTPRQPFGALPQPPRIPPPPDPADRTFVGVTRGEHWNAAVTACEMAVGEVIARCLYERADIHEMRKRVLQALARVRAPQPEAME